MIGDSPCAVPPEDGGTVRGLNYNDLRTLCFRLAMLTNTSVEFYYKTPYDDLIAFIDELEKINEERKG